MPVKIAQLRNSGYPRRLIKQINFDNFRFKNVFEIVPAFVHPAFRY